MARRNWRPGPVPGGFSVGGGMRADYEGSQGGYGGGENTPHPTPIYDRGSSRLPGGLFGLIDRSDDTGPSGIPYPRSPMGPYQRVPEKQRRREAPYQLSMPGIGNSGTLSNQFRNFQDYQKWIQQQWGMGITMPLMSEDMFRGSSAYNRNLPTEGYMPYTGYVAPTGRERYAQPQDEWERQYG